MRAQASLASDPAWLPHRIDLANRRVMFLRIDREQVSEHGFLADREDRCEQAWMPLQEYEATECDAGALRFVFHSGFCRSTLLVRALDIPGRSMGLNEPGILNSLIRAGPAGATLLRPTLDLLSRTHADGETVVIKPSNYANAHIAAILRERPMARAILMTDPLAVFLGRVARKGLMGRLWARQVYLELRAATGDDLGLDIEMVAGMTDFQVAGLGWFLNQQLFGALLADEHGLRLRSLWGETFSAERRNTLAAVTEFFGLKVTPGEIDSIVEGSVFRTDAKRGGDFEETERRNLRRGEGPVVAEEAAFVDEWIGSQARLANRRVPVPQTLL